MKTLKASAASLLAVTSLSVVLASPVFAEQVRCAEDQRYDEEQRVCVALVPPATPLIGGMSAGAAAAVAVGVVVLGIALSGGGSGTTTN